jgi:hypothetical protein
MVYMRRGRGSGWVVCCCCCCCWEGEGRLGCLKDRSRGMRGFVVVHLLHGVCGLKVVAIDICCLWNEILNERMESDVCGDGFDDGYHRLYVFFSGV